VLAGGGGGGRLAAHRDALHGHLIWACAFLGLHAVGLLVHTDSLLALGRRGDAFGDDALQLRPIFAALSARLIEPALRASPGGFCAAAPPAWASADFLLAHVHAFSAHASVVVLLKGAAFACNSRFVAPKAALGFRFPCDGPGRGGSCQISSWDHVYLGLFWVYNLAAVWVLGLFWRLEAELFGVAARDGRLQHLTKDFDLQATCIQGWLRDLLWSQASQVMQGYGTPLASYTLVFLLSHFVWSLSLMFLFSGRGYWQELVESLLWAHLKLRIVPALRPRALSITHGRAVGVAHFLLGGVGAFWAFFFAHLLA
jgi:photosystem I P700 chlorophyll a apoprotein A1